VADPKAVAVLDAADKWAAAPSDQARRAAFAVAEALGFDAPAGCVGAAVFFSEGSISLPNLPEVAPPPHVAPKMAANAVLLAAVISEPEKAAEKRARFVALGREVAAGTNRWAEAKPPTAAPPRPTGPAGPVGPAAAPRPGVPPAARPPYPPPYPPPPRRY
jgi:hypothetical protein